MKSSTLKKIIRWIMVTFATIEFVGVENVPTSGGVIIATNHLSRIDIPLLLINPAREDITALVTTKYQKYPVFKWFIETAGAIWLDRTKADFTAFRIAADVLKSGRALGIAPEGTRSKTGKLLEGKPGTVLLAVRTGVPVVPVGLAGTERSIKDLLTFRRPHLVAKFGKPFVLPELDRDNRDKSLQQSTDEVMCRIAAELPESYWGFYANYSRVKEILAEQGRL